MNGAHGMSAEIDNMQAANGSKTSLVLPSKILSGTHHCHRRSFYYRWERSGFDARYGRLTDQLHKLTAEVETAVTSLDIARTVERHATAEAEVLKAQNDAEQACSPCACCHDGLTHLLPMHTLSHMQSAKASLLCYRCMMRCAMRSLLIESQAVIVRANAITRIPKCHKPNSQCASHWCEYCFMTTVRKFHASIAMRHRIAKHTVSHEARCTGRADSNPRDSHMYELKQSLSADQPQYGGPIQCQS